jgi:hypothetical protein
MEQKPANKEENYEKDLNIIFGRLFWLNQIMQNPFDVYHESLLSGLNESIKLLRRNQETKSIRGSDKYSKEINFAKTKV